MHVYSTLIANCCNALGSVNPHGPPIIHRYPNHVTHGDLLMILSQSASCALIRESVFTDNEYGSVER